VETIFRILNVNIWATVKLKPPYSAQHRQPADLSGSTYTLVSQQRITLTVEKTPISEKKGAPLSYYQ
jgi:hypothetical protein